jgi:hypothetical protein
MKLNFDDSQGIAKRIGDSIVFVDYPNKSYTVAVKGVYVAAVYVVFYKDESGEEHTGVDTVYFSHDNGSYSVRKIHTHDGLDLTYQEESK